MTLKEKIDSYIKDNFDKISSLRKDKDFRWANLTKEIDKKVVINPEYLRSRFRFFGKKIDIKSTEKKRFFSDFSSSENPNTGEKIIKFTSEEIPNEKEIVSHFKIDLKKYRINQIYHKTSFGGRYAITVSIVSVKGNNLIDLKEEFIKQISKIEPLKKQNFILEKNELPSCSLLIPKQDAHWEKYDVYGKNDIEKRFSTFKENLIIQLEKVKLTNFLEEVVYIIGSDEFNSEFTKMTVNGTPQENMMVYNESFEKITDHNINTILLLSNYAKTVKVLLLNGNHDHNVSWHLAHLLKRVFINQNNIIVDDCLENTKIHSYKKNLILMNHGDVIKPSDLAAKFPIIAKDIWSNHNNFYCVSGDKHHEKSKDFNGITWYQVPQLSNAKSNWDDKKGHIVTKPELMTFVFEENGLVAILKNIIN